MLLILVGLLALTLGAELVVRYGARMARRMGVPPILVGLTIVSLGTSLPELAIGIDAVGAGAGSLAVGNIAGTNVVNLMLILGLSAAIRSIALGMQTLRLDIPAMAVASIMLFAFSLDGSLTVGEGAVLIGVGVVYTGLLVWATRREDATVQAEFAAKYPEERTEGGNSGLIVEVVLLLAGLAVIVAGAHLLVDGAVGVAREFGVSDALIGLTIVAIGTSAPELATTLISTVRGNRDIAIGNLIGSSTYNLTFILGTSLLFADGRVAVDPELSAVDLPVMVATALICIPVFLTGRRISRAEGALFVAAYVVYLVYLLVART